MAFSPDNSTHRSPRASTVRRLTVLALVVLGAALGWLVLRDRLSFDQLVARETQWREFVDTRPVTAYSTAFLLYVGVTVVPLPVAAGLSLVYGWLFGFWKSLVLVSFASTTGATGSFLLSRYVLGDAIQRRYADRLTAINAALDREGAFYLFALRLIPYVPFFVINPVMGLTRMRVTTFWWVSQLGMLPGTCVYLFAASSVTSLAELQRSGLRGILTPRIAGAFLLLALFPLVARRALNAWRRRRGASSPSSQHADSERPPAE